MKYITDYQLITGNVEQVEFRVKNIIEKEEKWELGGPPSFVLNPDYFNEPFVIQAIVKYND